LETATIRVLDEDGREKICATRERLIRPHSAAVLLYNIDKDAFVFTNQFRYPISDSNAQFLLEIPAGGIEENESPQTAAKREAMEEVGYKCNSLHKITSVYSSPGTTSECIHIYYAEVNNSDKVGRGGGNASENEEVQILYRDRRDVLSKHMEITDAKSLIALQWYLKHKTK